MYYPIMLDLADKKITIIGGGKVACRKAAHFLSFGGRVTVISPVFAAEFESYKGSMNFIQDSYKEIYIEDSDIVTAATDDKLLNSQIGSFCRERRILCNVVSSPELSGFIMPSVLRRGDLVISVSTGGSSPGLAGKIKRRLEAEYDGSYEEYVRLLGEIRCEVLKQNLPQTEKTSILSSLTEMNLEEVRDYRKKFK